jgi:drug/metabolite transporter (DMT)-like permease
LRPLRGLALLHGLRRYDCTTAEMIDAPSGRLRMANPGVGLEIAGALVSAVCYGAGSVLQAVAARRATPRPGINAGLLVDLARQAPYVVGLLLDGVGFFASLLALRRLPLFLVQAAIASSVGVTALLAWRFLGARLGRRDRVALAAVGLGLLLLALSAQPESARRLSGAGGWIVLSGLVVVLLLGSAAARGSGAMAAGGVAAAAGAAFGGVGVAARALVVPAQAWHLVTDPLTYAVVGYGVLGLLLFATALQRSSVTVASAIMFAVETVLPAGVGLAVLGDSARPGFVPAAVAGFAATVGGAVALARHGEPAA